MFCFLEVGKKIIVDGHLDYSTYITMLFSRFSRVGKFKEPTMSVPASTGNFSLIFSFRGSLFKEKEIEKKKIDTEII